MTDETPRIVVLIIEDDEDVAAMLQVTLRRAGYDVRVVHDGETGLETAREDAPDVILLDLMMAPMDGFEVMERLQADERTTDIPVVIASILTEEARVRDLGAAKFVKKPFAPGEVARAIASVRAS